MTEEPIPILGKASFKCPHCRANAHQDWYQLMASLCDENSAPFVPDVDFGRRIKEADSMSVETKQALIDWSDEMQTGGPFLASSENWLHAKIKVGNLWVSRCFSCKKVAVWVHDRLTFPVWNFAVVPNDDLPDEVKGDFIEAAKILDLSPRGSAALLRLCIQKLCKHLGRSGDNLNDDIAALVRDGLDARIQKPLDIVRVVGNNAVHPGQIDLTDDRDTASTLFRLVNIIADAMITQPRQVNLLYQELPESSRHQIEKRDARKG